MLEIRPTRAAMAILVLLALSAIAGCGRKSSESAALENEAGILRFVPADTPYVIVNAGPIDDELLDKMTGNNPEIMSAYRIVIDDAIRQAAAEYPESAPERVEIERSAEMMGRIVEFLSLDGMRAAGVDINASMAVYGNGLLPVLRARLTDADRFEAAIAGIEADAGHALEQGEIDGYSYRHAGDDEGRIVVAAIDDYVVITMVPSGFGDAELRSLLGLTLPAENLAKAGTLADLAREHGYTRHYLGYVDLRRITSTLVESRSGLDARLLQGAEFDPDALSDACRQEILELADIAPRTVFGYTRIADDGIDSSLTVELRPDLALGLTVLPSAIPGLGVDSGGLMSFGMSLDPAALRTFYEARLEAISADPWECEYFAELEASAERGRELLAQPIPPVVYGFRGVVGVVDRLDVAAMTTGQPPTSADAALLLAIENAPELLTMLAMFSPDLAALDIQPDGEPVALALPQAALLPDMPYAALTDSALVVSTGQGAPARISRLLAADAAATPPFLALAGDVGRYYETIAGAMLGPDAADELSPEARMAMADSLRSLAAVYDRLQVNVLFTKRGIRLDAGMTFKD